MMAEMTHDGDAATPLPLVNLRDLGGTSVAGGSVRPAVLWRGDDLTLSPREEVAALASQGLSTVLDLRATPEVSRSPHTAAAELGVDAHHLPLAEVAVNPLALLDAAPAVRSPADVGRWYAGLVRGHVHEVAQGLAIIGNAPGGVLFHCAAGKDRTGIMAAVILLLLGADREAIVEDYARTEQNLVAIFERLGATNYTPSEEASEEAKRAADFFASGHPLLSATADTMDSMITELGGAGGVRDLLHSETDPSKLSETLYLKLVQ